MKCFEIVGDDIEIDDEVWIFWLVGFEEVEDVL